MKPSSRRLKIVSIDEQQVLDWFRHSNDEIPFVLCEKAVLSDPNGDNELYADEPLLIK